MGVSTSTNPWAHSRSRRARTTLLRSVSSCRVRSLAHRSTSRWRYRVSTSATPCHLSPKLRRASAKSSHSATLTESSPRLVRTTSPRAPIQSPRLRRTNSSNRAVTAARANSWTEPDASRSSAKASFPCGRDSMILPATATVSPDSSPGASPDQRATTSAAACVRAKRYGIAPAPWLTRPDSRGGARCTHHAAPPDTLRS